MLPGQGTAGAGLTVPARRLVLWDVDLTLVRVGSIGRELYGTAFRQVTGRPLELRPQAAGRLDPDIYEDALAAQGLDRAAHPFAEFDVALTAVYLSRAGHLRERGRAMPGAEAALAALARVAGVVQSVLTGNVRAVALIKLAAFGLDRYLDVDVGAYGTDARLRAGLVRLAQRRAGARHGATFDAASTVLVGDSPLDVAAGHEGGASVVAVASGLSSEAELRAAGAGVVLPDLVDTAAVLAAVGAVPG